MTAERINKANSEESQAITWVALYSQLIRLRRTQESQIHTDQYWDYVYRNLNDEPQDPKNNYGILTAKIEALPLYPTFHKFHAFSLELGKEAKLYFLHHLEESEVLNGFAYSFLVPSSMIDQAGSSGLIKRITFVEIESLLDKTKEQTLAPFLESVWSAIAKDGWHDYFNPKVITSEKDPVFLCFIRPNLKITGPYSPDYIMQPPLLSFERNAFFGQFFQVENPNRYRLNPKISSD